jgi:methylenetetrahydrofolate dehydrogenase (NADP+)/methenyltetrahydrofolate cyclohydrolase
VRALNGRAVAATIRELTAARIAATAAPHVSCVLVGDDPASYLYVSNKRRAAAEIGATFEVQTLPATASAAAVEGAVRRLNQRPDVDGLLVQLPLPAASRARTEAILEAIAPGKDVDGLTAATRARLEGGQAFGLYPTPAYAVLVLLAVVAGDVDWRNAVAAHLAAGRLPALASPRLAGRRALVVSNGDVFGRVLRLVLERSGLVVAVRRSDAADLALAASRADVVVPAVGQPGCITGSMLKSGAVVVDVGTTRVAAALVGDLDWPSAAERDVTATPVPGGVGPVTVACLFANAVALRRLRERLEAR